MINETKGINSAISATSEPANYPLNLIIEQKKPPEVGLALVVSDNDNEAKEALGVGET